MSDRYFCAVIGQTFPNRAYFLAGTSFGHLTTSEIIVGGGYKPITGTIFDRMDAAGVSWTDYFSDLPYSRHLRDLRRAHEPPGGVRGRRRGGDAARRVVHRPLRRSRPDDQRLISTRPTSIRPPTSAQASTSSSQVINALRNSPSWNDSILF